MNADGWQGLEVRHLIALRAIADHGSFGRAADALGYSQSGVSQQLAALEKIVGARLLDRPGGRRPVRFTERGETLLRHADALLARVSAAQADFEALSFNGHGRLRVCIYQSVGARLLPQLLTSFRTASPSVTVQLHEAASDEDAAHMLASGSADLAFTMLPVASDVVESAEVLRDPYVLVVAADSPLARGSTPPTLEEIVRHPLICFRSCRHEHRAESQLRGRGLEPEVVFRSDDNGTVQSLVATGLGVALMPQLAVTDADDRVRVFELGDALAPRVIGIGWHRDRVLHPAAMAFVELARETGSRLAGRQRTPAADAHKAFVETT